MTITIHRATITCPTCKGTGKYSDDGSPCLACHGTGIDQVDESLSDSLSDDISRYWWEIVLAFFVAIGLWLVYMKRWAFGELKSDSPTSTPADRDPDAKESPEETKSHK